MEVYISIDMEGVAGIVSRDQVIPTGGAAYRRACELMTREANAAVAGAIAGGATRVVVNDSHGRMANLDPELLDRRSECSTGYPKPYGMLAGLSSRYACALFVGYHAGAGAAPAVLDHTYSPRVFRAVRLNGVRQTETSLNAALAGWHDVPVALVTGDETTCAEAQSVLGADVPTVATKSALGAEAAMALHPAVARERIEAGAREGLTRFAARRLTPLRIDPPYLLECDVTSTLVADLAATIPAVDRPAGRTLRFAHDDYPTVFRCLLAIAMIGGLAATA